MAVKIQGARSKFVVAVAAMAAATLAAAVPAAASSAAVPGAHLGGPAAPASAPAHRAADPGDESPLPNDPAVPDAHQWSSHVWSGWVDVANQDVALRYVTANFVVPSVKCSSLGESVAFWVGLDGLNGSDLPVPVNKTVEQDGVEVNCDISTPSGPMPSYDSFWYMFAPTNSKSKFCINCVSPGDTIAVSVYYDSAADNYHLALSDSNTTAPDFNTSQTCPTSYTCHNATAEVIAEDPGGGVASGVYLPNFGTVHFSSVGVTSRDGTKGTLYGNSLWSAGKITMEDSGGTVMAQPSDRTDGNTAFSDTFHSSS
jgi:hypothetical protein